MGGGKHLPMNARHLLLYLATKHQGDWSAMMRAIKNKEPVSPLEVEANAERNQRSYMTLLDADFPVGLKNLTQPPFVLFYKGNIDLIKDYKKCITIVGSRDSSAYGMKKTHEIAEGLAKEGFTIVSGLAKGIDASAMKGAVDFNKAVGVLGNGLGYHYPAENYDLQEIVGEKGLLLSEYPDFVKPAKHHFPDRNRILAGLSCLTILGGSKPKSGTLITAGVALDSGRDVACLPYRADEDSANNLLIQTGAALVQNTKDVLDLLATYQR